MVSDGGGKVSGASGRPAVIPADAFAGEIAAAQACLDAFMLAFNARDVEALDRTFNFPHVRFARGTVTIMRPGDHKPAIFQSARAGEWARSAWLRREVISAGRDKVHLDTRVGRFRIDGSLIVAFDSIYIVTCLDGRWGIQARSSYLG